METKEQIINEVISEIIMALPEDTSPNILKIIFRIRDKYYERSV